MIIQDILDLKQNDAFFVLEGYLGEADVYLKLEGLNLSGSIKLKTALSMIKGLEERGEIQPGRHRIIESSSGNLGIALSMICKKKGYEFLCVVDPNVTRRSRELIELYGGKIVLVTEPDANGGYLGSRIRRIRELLSEDPCLVWTNQYANRDNYLAHYETTAREIQQQFPKLDYLFVGAGTTGTLRGCAQYFKEKCPITKIIGVDPVGSVTFGYPAGKRLLSGVGTSRAPEIVSLDNVHGIVRVSESDTIITCRDVLARYGLLIGPSSGSALRAVSEYKAEYGKNETIVVVSPDFGDKYIDTVFNSEWTRQNFDL